jgi:hypothetical protein
MAQYNRRKSKGKRQKSKGKGQREVKERKAAPPLLLLFAFCLLISLRLTVA